MTPSGNTVQPHQCGTQATAGWQTVHGAFCQTIMKSYQIHCQITNNIDKILPKFYIFFIKRLTSTMDLLLIVLLEPATRQNSKLKSCGVRPP